MFARGRNDGRRPMIVLRESLAAWGSLGFDAAFAREVEQLGVAHLPLQQGLRQSSMALDHRLKVMVLNKGEADNQARIKIGAFYTGIQSGCSCADDPTPVEEQNEYCEMMIGIDLADGVATVTLLDD